MAEITGPSYIPRGTKCKCTMGATEQRLNLLVDHGIIATASREPLMNANDHVPMVNIMPFGFCKKGMPCMPVTPVAWVDVNKKHIIDGAPALTEDSKLACAHGGVITIVPLDAGSAEEGKMNEIVESAVEKVGLALKMAGAIADCIDVFSPGGLVKMAGKKGAAKNLKGGGNKGKGSEGVENKGQASNKSLENRGNNKEVSSKAEGIFTGEIKASEIPNMTKREIIEKLPKDWKYAENNGFVHVRDANGTIRMRIDPPDKVTKYDHVHLFDENKNPIDIGLNIVDKKSPNAHIPYKR